MDTNEALKLKEQVLREEQVRDLRKSHTDKRQERQFELNSMSFMQRMKQPEYREEQEQMKAHQLEMVQKLHPAHVPNFNYFFELLLNEKVKNIKQFIAEVA